MAVETATNISQLVATSPAGADPISEGAPHIRVVKAAVKGTFPNVTGAVNPTHTELNHVVGVTSAIQTQLNTKQATITGGATTIAAADLTASRALISGATGKVEVSPVTSAELAFVDGVTSNIQTQLNGKSATTHNHAGVYEPVLNTDQKRKITISAAAPSGGVDGDVWLKV